MRRIGWRWPALILVIFGLAPGTWLRTHIPPPEAITFIAIEELPPGERVKGELRLAGQWELSSPSMDFGGFSALLARPDGSFLALSDLGMALSFADPRGARSGRLPARLGPAGERRYVKAEADIESAAQSADGGTVWLGFEMTNRIVRSFADWSGAETVSPEGMAEWSINSGAEAMARLDDGRFIVISEGAEGWRDSASPAILFAGDPVEDAGAVPFRFVPPDGFRPSDMAILPDGRALILLRGVDWTLPPRFTSRLVVADPATIEEGADWQWQAMPPFPAGMIAENYEGLAAVPRAPGTYTIWLISDDNKGALQRTLLVELEWTPEAAASGKETP